MKNWKKVNTVEYEKILDFIYTNLSFNPNNTNKISIIKLPVPNISYDISNNYNENFDLSLYDDLENKTKKVFEQISNENEMLAIKWQGTCYKFNPMLKFEIDEFEEWLIPIFPNGDFSFFFTENLKNGIFADGINFSISIFGEDMINLFLKNKPIIFNLDGADMSSER